MTNPRNRISRQEIRQPHRRNCSLRQHARKWIVMATALVCTVKPFSGQELSRIPEFSSAGRSPIFGSVPTGTASRDVLRISLQGAIDMAIRYNLGAIESGEAVHTSRAQRILALSRLLPEVDVGIGETVSQSNLATLGLNGAALGLSQVIGPYSYSDVRAGVAGNLFSAESIQKLRAAQSVEQASRFSYSDTLEAITLTTGAAYLNVIAADSRIHAAEAQTRSAQALHDQAVEALKSGTIPRIDEMRTAVQLDSERYNLSVMQNNFKIAKLVLGRIIGMPLGQEYEVTDQLHYSERTPLALEAALKSAYTARPDLIAALKLQKAAEQNLAAAHGQRYPVIAFRGDYGALGPTFGNSHGSFDFVASMSIPVFTGGRIKADIERAESIVRQRKAEADIIRGQIDYDVRASLFRLDAAEEQVRVATHSVGLAKESLERSKERFSSGVTDSVEVVQAEQSLASANDQYITSLHAYNIADLELARALGVTHSRYRQFLGGTQ